MKSGQDIMDFSRMGHRLSLGHRQSKAWLTRRSSGHGPFVNSLGNSQDQERVGITTSLGNRSSESSTSIGASVQLLCGRISDPLIFTICSPLESSWTAPGFGAGENSAVLCPGAVSLNEEPGHRHLRPVPLTSQVADNLSGPRIRMFDYSRNWASGRSS
jgi:hypothetical protein